MLQYLFNEVVSPLLRLTSFWVCAGAAPLLFVFKECLCSLGDHLQDLSPTTRLYSKHQRTRVLQSGIAAFPSFLLFSFFNFIVLAETS
jgi:hypothetical protein